MKIKFIDGPFDGQVRDIAIPPVKFEFCEMGSDGQVIDPDENRALTGELTGYYEQDSISELMGYAIFTWVPCVGIPGCLKPLDSIKFAANHESPEARQIATVALDGETLIWENRKV